MIRYALVSGHPLRAVARYLPDGYQGKTLVAENVYTGAWRRLDVAIAEANESDKRLPFVEREERLYLLVEGEDHAGWTLDDYVIPRLGSGNYGCREIDLSHPALKVLPL